MYTNPGDVSLLRLIRQVWFIDWIGHFYLIYQCRNMQHQAEFHPFAFRIVESFVVLLFVILWIFILRLIYTYESPLSTIMYLLQSVLLLQLLLAIILFGYFLFVSLSFQFLCHFFRLSLVFTHMTTFEDACMLLISYSMSRIALFWLCGGQQE